MRSEKFKKSELRTMRVAPQENELPENQETTDVKNRDEESKHNNKALPNQTDMYEQIGIAFTQWLGVGKPLESPQKNTESALPSLKRIVDPDFREQLTPPRLKESKLMNLGSNTNFTNQSEMVVEDQILSSEVEDH